MTIDKQLLKPARLHNETYADYRKRRAEGNRLVKLKLSRGKMVWASVRVIQLNLDSDGQLTLDPAKMVRPVHVKERVQGTYRKPWGLMQQRIRPGSKRRQTLREARNHG